MRPTYNLIPFSRWLRNKIYSHDILVYPMASDIGVSPKTIYNHMNGIHAPTFPIIVAYCWYFNDGDDPREIWKMIEES